MSEDERLTTLIETVSLLAQWSRGAEGRIKGLTENQALFAQAQVRLAEAQAGLAEEQVKIAKELARLVEAQANWEFKLAALTDAQIRTDEAMVALSEQMKETAAQAAHTDRRLDALIDIVRGTHEGNPPRQS